MGVDHDPFGQVEGVAQNHICGFTADSRQPVKSLHGAGNLSPMIGHQGGGAGAQRAGFGSIEPGGVDHPLQLRLGDAGEGGGVRAAGKEGGGDLVHPLIGALGGKDGGDEELEGRGEMKRAVGVGIGTLEGAEDLVGPAPEGGGGFHGAGGAEAAGRD